ncbi:MAG: hypothetical protein QXV17_14675 [Candidatus Micrarchaeaceae archaeon]
MMFTSLVTKDEMIDFIREAYPKSRIWSNFIEVRKGLMSAKVKFRYFRGKEIIEIKKDISPGTLVILVVVAILLYDIHFLGLFSALIILVVYLWLDNKFIKEVVAAFTISGLVQEQREDYDRQSFEEK